MHENHRAILRGVCVKKMGWKPELSRDPNDYTPEHPKIKERLKAYKASLEKTLKLTTEPYSKTDLRKGPYLLPKVYDQGNIGSCAANAGTFLMEYIQLKQFKDAGKDADYIKANFIPFSRLFLYRVALNFDCELGDAGLMVKSVFKVLQRFGITPEKFWPYADSPVALRSDPTGMCYETAKEFQALHYFRIDQEAKDPDHPTIEEANITIKNIKSQLDLYLPVMFGTTVFDSWWMEDAAPKNPNPGKLGLLLPPNEKSKVVGGHAIVIVGYDDTYTYKDLDGQPGQGVFIIRNSWGKNWGDGGYGYLPYSYVLSGYATEFYCITANEWIKFEDI